MEVIGCSDLHEQQQLCVVPLIKKRCSDVEAEIREDHRQMQNNYGTVLARHGRFGHPASDPSTLLLSAAMGQRAVAMAKLRGLRNERYGRYAPVAGRRLGQTF